MKFHMKTGVCLKYFVHGCSLHHITRNWESTDWLFSFCMQRGWYKNTNKQNKDSELILFLWENGPQIFYQKDIIGAPLDYDP